MLHLSYSVFKPLLRPQILRPLHCSSLRYAVSDSPLFKLRQKTGLTYSLCREALNKHDNNIEHAEAWLQAQALAHGLQRATRLRDRTATEGLIGLAVDEDHKTVTFVEVNCETDFVAKNRVFTDLTSDITTKVLSFRDHFESINLAESDSVSLSKITSDQKDQLNSYVAPLVTKLGENIMVSRACSFRVSDIHTYLFGQIHAQTNTITSEGTKMIIGRFGSILALTDLSQTVKLNDKLVAIGNRLCQHVIGFSPTYIELPDEIRKHLESEEAKKSEKVHDTVTEEGEDSDTDELGETKSEDRSDWPSIMDQPLIMSDDQTVRDFCGDSQVKIEYFKRIECGGSS